MNRVEHFRTSRQTRYRYIISFLLFFILLIAGICAVDYSVNSLTRNINGIEIITVRSIDDSNYELNFANKKFHLNTKYIKRDYQRLKNTILGIFK